MLWFSLVIGQNTSHQLATSSENLVARVQFLVALATSESQFRALYVKVGDFQVPQTNDRDDNKGQLSLFNLPLKHAYKVEENFDHLK